MSSLTTGVSFRPRSLSGVRDVVESYRRVQEYLSDSVSHPANDTCDDGEEEYLEQEALPSDEEDIPDDDPSDEALPYDDVHSNLHWDEDLISGPSQDINKSSPRSFVLPVSRRRPSYNPLPPFQTPTISIQKAEERTPLLGKRLSVSYAETPIRSTHESSLTATHTVSTATARRMSQLSARKIGHDHHQTHGKAKMPSGHSTFGQTLFNAIAILLGIGMLSEPLAFALAGWVGGTLIVAFYGLVTCYTAKILANMILEDPRLKTYSDIGRKAFGPHAGPWIISVALVTLYADSLHAIVPTYSSNTYKVIGLLIMIPTTFMPLSVLSYTSILGISSTLLIIIVVLIDGFAKTNSPGSFWSPAETSIGAKGVGELGLAFGLFMAGLAGHAVIPSLVRDMSDPSQFDSMITQAFTVATVVYSVIGVSGYIMFGNAVSDEFSKDLAQYSVYPVLNRIALWGLVLSPLSKFALSSRPLNVALEMMLGIEGSSAPVEEHGPKTQSHDVESNHTVPKSRRILRSMFVFIERTLLTLCSVAVSIFVPEFSSMMAFLGAFSSFLLSVIGPVSAKIALSKRCSAWDAFLLVAGVIMATWGTAAAFWSMRGS
ncbi:uncharacterized protein FIBRA_02991 [Fibroporia radiculosa]|uniref:Amino acid transporter transmembrane domain-containing protein n=1 Tax=Fibroporia radiculosa TaxID=599839 RepID=J4H257_9APHY|nr:uncharacterized protein FIBRA_02991 [Fibroporia radiculosa]CCM00944.1 predicted protein [Fibroporia radiculosa]